jgi:hypothetical protein
MAPSPSFDHTPAAAGDVPSRKRVLMRCVLAGLLLVAGVGSLVALTSVAGSCSPASTLQPQTSSSDCSAQAPYVLNPIEQYVSGVAIAWFSYGDLTPGATHTGQDGGAIYAVPIEDGGHCGAQNALLLQSYGHNDYGSGFGTYDLGAGQPFQDYLNGIQSGNRMSPQYDPRVNVPDSGCMTPDAGFVNCSIDAGGYEGVSFWARSFDPTGNVTTKTVNVALADKDTAYGIGSTCTLCCGTNGIEGGVITTTGAAGASVTTVSGFAGGGALWYPIGCPSAEAGSDYFAEAGPGVVSALPPPYCCGNNFTYYSLQTTEQWTLYTLPWSSFHQLAQPTRSPQGFDPTTVFQFLVTVPKEAHLSLWIHDIAFYRTKQGGAGAEAGP